MSGLEDMVRQADNLIRMENQRFANEAIARNLEREIEQLPQKMAAEDLHKLLERIEESERKREEDKREQAKENRLNHIYNLVALLVAIASMVISLVK